MQRDGLVEHFGGVDAAGHLADVLLDLRLEMVDQRVAAEKQNGVRTPYVPPMTRRLKCRIDPEQSPYTCMLPEHKPVRRGREMIDLLAVEEPKPKPAKIRAVS